MNAPDKKYILIVDYNLTRFLDIKMMTTYAAQKYGLEAILIRPNPQAYDKEVAAHIIDLDPRAPGFLEKAMTALETFASSIAAVLPFSDNAVKTGAELAERLGVRGDSGALAQAAYSKISYRETETSLKELFNAQGVFVPRFKIVYTEQQLRAFAESCPDGFVLKPSCEGNNRGVLRLDRNVDLSKAFEEVKSYLASGLICEELITFPEEYSFDGIGHLHWITEKMSLSSRYPVEKGQIIPARQPVGSLAAIARAGCLANLVVGQKSGPFHNEVKLDPAQGQAAVIEPNRRPAGMKIWHLAAKVYGLNFFHLWIDQLLTGCIPGRLPDPRGVAAIRELTAPRAGLLSAAVTAPGFAEALFKEIKAEMPEGLQWSEFRITAEAGTTVHPEPKDNAGFIAEVCLYSRDASIDVRGLFDHFEAVFGTLITSYILEQRSSS